MISATLVNRATRPQMIPFRCNIRSLQSIASREPFPSIAIRFIRFKSTTAASNRLSPQPRPLPPRQSQKFIYPEKLCIYQAQSYFMTATKFSIPFFDTTVIVCICLAAWNTSKEYSVEAIATFLMSFIMHITCARIVREIHLPLPSHARVSRQHLRDYTDNLPLSIALEVSRGLPGTHKVRHIAISDLINAPGPGLSRIFYQREQRPAVLYTLSDNCEKCGWVLDVLYRRVRGRLTRT
ncbi:hypothetical protein F5B19DRAFT_464321 [Rostrohypoxylon terebratum]|nr:hypothetical protein F5B19DRAFT_464321 [Rostrohypoxylon terebratum]